MEPTDPSVLRSMLRMVAGDTEDDDIELLNDASLRASESSGGALAMSIIEGIMPEWVRSLFSMPEERP